MQYVHSLLLLLLLFLFLPPRGHAQTPEPVSAWTYPYEVRYQQLSDSVRLAYVDTGEAREGTLLFVHGLGSNLQAWNKTIAGLSDRYRCVAVDLPGYGKSSQEDYPFTMPFYADQLDAFVRALTIGRLTLVGHSMGGQIVLELASRQPDWLRALVLAAPAGLETFNAENRQFFDTYVRPEIVTAASPEQIEQNFDLNFFGGTQEDARFMIDDRMQLRADTAAYAYYGRLIAGSVAGMLDGPVIDKLDRVGVPVLLVYGLEDRLIPNQLLHPGMTVHEVAQSGMDRLSDAEFRLLERAGHFVQWDRPEAFNAEIAAFLEEQ